jgi:hypothetical protein
LIGDDPTTLDALARLYEREAKDLEALDPSID